MEFLFCAKLSSRYRAEFTQLATKIYKIPNEGLPFLRPVKNYINVFNIYINLLDVRYLHLCHDRLFT